MTLNEPYFTTQGGFDFSKTLTVKTIQQARTKPKNCSDVRWRIELRRRKKAEYFNAIPDNATW